MQFSVVIPLYNKRDYIERTLDSVRRQTWTQFEVIVVNDGSTDDSEAVARRAIGDDPRFRLVSQANAGVSVARNRGVAEARHDWVALLDSDDTWVPDFLETMQAVLTRYPHIRLVTGNQAIQWGDEPPQLNNYGFPPEQDVVVDFDFYAIWAQYGSINSSSSTVIHKPAFQAVGGFPPGVSLGEDLMLWMKLADTIPMAYVNRLMMVYHRDDEAGSLTLSPSIRTLRSHERLLEAIDAAVRRGRCPASLLDRHLDIHFHALLGCRSAWGYRLQFVARHARRWSARQWVMAALATTGLYRLLREWNHRRGRSGGLPATSAG